MDNSNVFVSYSYDSVEHKIGFVTKIDTLKGSYHEYLYEEISFEYHIYIKIGLCYIQKRKRDG